MNLLLHTCCANCALVPIELLKDQLNLTLFWYNPNIHPQEEHKKRLTEVKRLAEIYQLSPVEFAVRQIERSHQMSNLSFDYFNYGSDYDSENKKWFNLTKGLEQEPEGHQRCQICFQMRLEKTAQYVKENKFPTKGGSASGWDYFSTTLGISRHKNTKLIDQLGQSIAKQYQLKYYPLVLDKNQAFQRELELAKKYNFYRQKYCGCIYSQK